MKILIIQTAFIGDVILATPLIEKLSNHFPNSKIDFLLRKGNESLLENHPKLNKVLIFDKKRKKYKSLLQIIFQIRKEKYDIVINAQRFATTGIITISSKAKITIGFKKNPFSFLFTRKVEHEFGNGNDKIHEVDRNLKLIENLTNKNFFPPKLYPSKQDFEKVDFYQNYICIAPTSVWFTKQLSEKKWLELINKINSEINILLLGAPSDFNSCESIIQNSKRKNSINLAGKLTLLQSAALMKNARMNFVNDSAPLHLASSMDAPVTAFFCSTVPGFGFYPLSTKSYILENEESLSCRPCGLHGKKECPQNHFRCSEIDFEDILDKENLI